MKDTVILGSGIAGLSLARALSQRGVRVTVCGRMSPPYCASSAALGLSSTKGMYAAETGLFQDKLRGHEILGKLLEGLASKRALPAAKSEVLEPFLDQKEYNYINQRVFRNQFTAPFGVIRESLAVLTDEMKKILNPAVLGLLRYPSDFWFDCEATLKAMSEGLLVEGVNFIEEEAYVIRKTEVGFELAFGSKKLMARHLILASGSSLPAHCSMLGVHFGSWKMSKGATVKAVFERKSKTALVLLRKTEGIAFYNNSVRIGSIKGSDPETIAPTIKQTIESWSPLLHQNLLSDFHGKDWETRNGVRMRIQERHHRPVAEVIRYGDNVLLGVVGGFHKSGWQLAPVVADDLAKQWLASH